MIQVPHWSKLRISKLTDSLFNGLGITENVRNIVRIGSCPWRKGGKMKNKHTNPLLSSFEYKIYLMNSLMSALQILFASKNTLYPVYLYYN